MEMTPDGGTTVRFNVDDDQIPLIAAILTPAVNQQRSYFFDANGRPPDPGEFRLIQSRVINDWYLMIDRLQEDRQAMRDRMTHEGEGAS